MQEPRSDQFTSTHVHDDPELVCDSGKHHDDIDKDGGGDVPNCKEDRGENSRWNLRQGQVNNT